MTTTFSEMFLDESRRFWQELEAAQMNTESYETDVNQAVLDHFDRLLDIMADIIFTFSPQEAAFVKSRTSNVVRLLT